jgi:hypothetical protein
VGNAHRKKVLVGIATYIFKNQTGILYNREQVTRNSKVNLYNSSMKSITRSANFGFAILDFGLTPPSSVELENFRLAILD